MPVSDNLLKQPFPGTKIAWIVGNDGIVRRTADAGTSWATELTGITNDLHGMATVSADMAWQQRASGTTKHRRTVDQSKRRLSKCLARFQLLP